jgi:glycosyltransferase involved in cell wall biosynthesis
MKGSECQPQMEFESVCDEGVEVSIVMPCLNEERTVGRCIDKCLVALRRMNIDGEVVVADNGSSDNSCERAKLHGAFVIDVPQRGYGRALIAGICAARGNFVIVGDADDSYDFTGLDVFINRLNEGYDLVVGNRFRGGIEPGAMRWIHRYFGNPFLSGLLNVFFHTPVKDAQCGLRAFRKDAFRRLELRAPGMEFASEMVAKAKIRGLRMCEVPIVLHPDGRDRPSHLRTFRDGWRYLWLLLTIWASPAWYRVIGNRGDERP